MNWVGLLVPLISGVIGSNLVGSLSKKLSLGPVGNSIAGLLGGGIGAALAFEATGVSIAATANTMGLGPITAALVGGGAGGAALNAIIGAVRNKMQKPS